jgi:hypothetical protein
MHTKTIYILVVITCFVAVLSYGCKKKKLPPGYNKRRGNTFSVKGSVRQINIRPETPQFPKHNGKGEFVSYCSMCHSLQYIVMQPDFPRKTWEAEVTKMIVKFKAPIDSVTAKKIVEYLVAVKSKA